MMQSPTIVTKAKKLNEKELLSNDAIMLNEKTSILVTIVTKDFTILGLTRERKEIDHDFSSTVIGCKIHENPLLSWLSDF